MHPPEQWTTAMHFPTLLAQEIHIWKFSLEATHYNKDDLQRLEQTLSPQEQQRLVNIISERGKADFIISHGLTHLILAGYLGISPKTIHFTITEEGKPHLHPALNGTQNLLQFNLSHSHGMALLALGHNTSIGIDLEKNRTHIAHIKLARRFFSESESAELQQMPDEQQQRGFFMGWARKEALVKANGKGIAKGFHDFAVPMTPQHSIHTLCSNAESKPHWIICDLPLGEHYSGAVACNAENAAFRLWEWNSALMNSHNSHDSQHP